MVVGIAVLLSNAVAAGWGAIGWLRKDARASLAFWPLLRVAQATVVIQVVVGFLLANALAALFLVGVIGREVWLIIQARRRKGRSELSA